MHRYILFCLFVFLSCSKNNKGQTPTPPVPAPANDIFYWLTSGDQSSLLQKQSATLHFGTTANSYPNLDVDSTKKFQRIDGFGFTLTGGSAQVISQLGPANKTALLNELFGKDSNSISISYLRVSIGASDLDSAVFSYDDLPSGQTDTSLAHFSLGVDTITLIPLLKQILQINPSIQIIAAPWSAPVWMKDNGLTSGGHLLPAYYVAYAKYFVKYIQKMSDLGIQISAITPQNEPLNPNNNPSLVMSAAEQASFIKSALGPAFQNAGLHTKIVVYDHNCDVPEYATSIFADAQAAAFTDGAAFHLYAGDISVLGQIHNAYPAKNLYFTEQYTASTGSFAGDLQWHISNVIIGSVMNWSRTALEWNLASDASFGPHTPGGCTTCKPAVTVDGAAVTRNVGYYIIAHASKFVPAGSVRIGGSPVSGLPNVAFATPSGKKVLIAMNTQATSTAFNIRYKGKWAPVFLPAGSAATFVW